LLVSRSRSRTTSSPLTLGRLGSHLPAGSCRRQSLRRVVLHIAAREHGLRSRVWREAGVCSSNETTRASDGRHATATRRQDERVTPEHRPSRCRSWRLDAQVAGFAVALPMISSPLAASAARDAAESVCAPATLRRCCRATGSISVGAMDAWASDATMSARECSPSPRSARHVRSRARSG
jgi:hypothetical protein